MAEPADVALWNPAAHEPVSARAWDEVEAKAAIARIVEGARRTFIPDTLWPVHPNDSPHAAEPLRMIYFGAAGVIWALDHLARVGATDNDSRFAPVLADLIEPNRRMLANFTTAHRSLLMGDAGILLTQWRADPSAHVADALATVVAQNTDDAALELMWGAPGTMLVALAMAEQTGEPRWTDYFRAGAAALERTFIEDEASGCRLWTQDLYGHRVKMLGAVHGFAGNAFALIRGRRLLAADAWARWSRRIADTFAATAVRTGQGVNWPQSVGDARPGRTALLMQHCHGAPGMVTCLAGLDQDVEALLIAAGETVWAAGPLKKGANLCHGTAGNGYAFLKLFERTRDRMWLDRARAFAMHAIAQSHADENAFGALRYSLWTGDLGLAIYLQDCIEGRARFPTMDVF